MKQRTVDVGETEYNVSDTKLPYENFDQFLGRYGNFARGNLTVVSDDTLTINFDIFSCSVRNVTEEVQICTGLDPFWFLTLYRVQFDNENNPSQFVDVTFDKKEDPVRFERDLMLEDAPEHRDYWPQCRDA